MARSLRKGPRKFTGTPSRLQMHAQNNLGTILTTEMGKARRFRSDTLELYDQYYENRQYDDLMDWEAAEKSDEYVPVRDRKPRIIYNISKVVIDKIASKLVGSSVFPKFVIEDDPEDTEYLRMVQRITGFRRNLLQPMKQCLLAGSVFVRYYFVNGIPEMEYFNSKFCYPKFDATGELDEIRVQYVYEDVQDLDHNQKPKKKWYRLDLTKIKDVLFDNPEYREGVTQPDFKVVEQNDHGLGWVQGEWFRTAKFKFDPDGPSLIGDILDFLDDVNYSLSQSSRAISYNQEPQLTVKGIDEDELDDLISSSQKAWTLGREGEAAFVESTMKGVEAAMEQRKESRMLMLEVVRCVLNDPDKMVGSAQSGRALEILNAPLVELVDELRTTLEPQLVNLLIKLSMTIVTLEREGMETVLELPEGYAPHSLDITVSWPAIFPPTIQDIQMKTQTAVQAAQGHIISHETATRWVAGDFGIENIDEELDKIQNEAETMPFLNPFGDFGFGGGGDSGGK